MRTKRYKINNKTRYKKRGGAQRGSPRRTDGVDQRGSPRRTDGGLSSLTLKTRYEQADPAYPSAPFALPTRSRSPSPATIRLQSPRIQQSPRGSPPPLPISVYNQFVTQFPAKKPDNILSEEEDPVTLNEILLPADIKPSNQKSRRRKAPPQHYTQKCFSDHDKEFIKQLIKSENEQLYGSIVSGLEKAFEHLDGTIGGIKSDFSHLDSSIRALKKQIDEDTQENTRIKKRYIELTTTLDGDISTLQTDISELRREAEPLARISKMFIELKGDLKKIISDFKPGLNNSHLTKIVSGLKPDNLQESFALLKQSIDSLKPELNDGVRSLKSHIDSYSAKDIRILKEDILKVEQRLIQGISGLQSFVISNPSIGSLKEDIAGLQESIAELHSKPSSIPRNNAHNNARFSTLESIILEKFRSIEESLQSQHIDKSNISSIMSNIGELKSSIGKLQLKPSVNGVNNAQLSELRSLNEFIQANIRSIQESLKSSNIKSTDLTHVTKALGELKTEQTKTTEALNQFFYKKFVKDPYNFVSQFTT